MEIIIIYVLELNLLYPSYSSFAFNYVIRDTITILLLCDTYMVYLDIVTPNVYIV